MADVTPVGPRQLAITTQFWVEGVIVFRIVGELDLATVPQLRAALRAGLAGPVSPKEVRVDLAATTFIDAAGIGALVDGKETARRAGVGFSVENPLGIVRRVLDIFGLADALRVEQGRRTVSPPRTSPPGSPML